MIIRDVTGAEPVSHHIIGRLTAPIMWFFICEGYHYTRDVKKYMIRLGIFAVISHFAYCFGFGIELNPFKGGIFNRTSVMYPLFIQVYGRYFEENGERGYNMPKMIIIMKLTFQCKPSWNMQRNPVYADEV